MFSSVLNHHNQWITHFVSLAGLITLSEWKTIHIYASAIS